MAKLIFMGERFGGRVYELAREKTTIGRGDQNILTIHDGSVSHSHCEILVNGPEVIVCDLGSANGTFINGNRVQQQSQVKSGQTVRFGTVEARLELDLPAWEDTASEESAVFAARRYERKQELEEKMPKPSMAPVTLESDTITTDRTILMPVPRLTAAPPPPTEPAKAHRKSNLPRVIWIGLAVAVVLALSIWMIFGRK